jgi:zinc transporter ZupT
MNTPVWIVFLAALATALATGLGALPFVFVRRMSLYWLGVSNAIAAGVMLAASVTLVREGVAYSGWRTAVGALLGIVFIALVRQVLRNHEHLEVGALRGADARKAIMIVAVMTAHSFTEGVGVGVSYGGGQALGAFITAAIAVHNIPEGLAISLVLVPRGVRVLTAAGWSVFSSLPQPLMAVPAFVFVEAFTPFLPAGLGFAAGAMVWMVVSELRPEALEAASGKAVAVSGMLAFAAMMAFQELVL